MSEFIGAKRCGDCRFSNDERPDPKMIKPVLMCRYGPLHPVAVLIPAGGGMTTQIRALCPAVAEGDWCHRFEARILPPH